MGLKEVVVGPDAGDIRPLCGRYRVGVHVVDFCERGSQHERGVGGDDELALIEPCHPGDELRQIYLELCRKRVLRLVKEVKATGLDGIGEVLETALPIGVGPLIKHTAAFHIS